MVCTSDGLSLENLLLNFNFDDAEKYESILLVSVNRFKLLTSSLLFWILKLVLSLLIKNWLQVLWIKNKSNPKYYFTCMFILVGNFRMVRDFFLVMIMMTEVIIITFCIWSWHWNLFRARWILKGRTALCALTVGSQWVYR